MSRDKREQVIQAQRVIGEMIMENERLEKENAQMRGLRDWAFEDTVRKLNGDPEKLKPLMEVMINFFGAGTVLETLVEHISEKKYTLEEY